MNLEYKESIDIAVKKKMNVIFKDEEDYQKFKTSWIHSNKGLRTEDGKLSLLLDIEEVDEECKIQQRELEELTINEIKGSIKFDARIKTELVK